MKLALILAIILAVLGGGATAAKLIYAAGYNERDRLAAIETEKSRQQAQDTINAIEKQAVIDAQKNADLQISSKVEKAVADARKANPACSLIVPRGVSDALRGHI